MKRLPAATIGILELHDKRNKTAFLKAYNPDAASNRLGPVGSGELRRLPRRQHVGELADAAARQHGLLRRPEQTPDGGGPCRSLPFRPHARPGGHGRRTARSATRRTGRARR